ISSRVDSVSDISESTVPIPLRSRPQINNATDQPPAKPNDRYGWEPSKRGVRDYLGADQLVPYNHDRENSRQGSERQPNITQRTYSVPMSPPALMCTSTR